MSLIDEDGGKSVRMANLATVGSHAVNGVAALHTELLKRDVLHDFDELWPEQFTNKTNGVTPRRFLALSNPGLRELITEHDRRRLADGPRASSASSSRSPTTPRSAAQWRAVKRANKARLADYVAVDGRRRRSIPTALFDVQVKRIHEYKRQHLNVLHIDHAVPPAEAEPRRCRSRRARSSSAARRRPATRWRS